MHCCGRSSWCFISAIGESRHYTITLMSVFSVQPFVSGDIQGRSVIDHVSVASLTKATVGGVPPFSLVCLSHSHE